MQDGAHTLFIIDLKIPRCPSSIGADGTTHIDHHLGDLTAMDGDGADQGVPAVLNQYPGTFHQIVDFLWRLIQKLGLPTFGAFFVAQEVIQCPAGAAITMLDSGPVKSFCAVRFDIGPFAKIDFVRIFDNDLAELRGHCQIIIQYHGQQQSQKCKTANFEQETGVSRF